MNHTLTKLTLVCRAALLVLAMGLFPLALAGCGGGGGGNPNPNPNNGTTSITGKVLLVSGAPPVAAGAAAGAPAATVTAGGVTANASSTDGSFTLSGVNAGATSLTVTAKDGATTVNRTVPITLTANKPNDLGVIYVTADGYTANVTGRVTTVTSTGTTGVGNARVTLAGVSTLTDASGAFALANLPVGLGTVPGQLIGIVSAAGFETLQITSETIRFPLAAGANPLSAFVIQIPSGATPLPPYTITGKATVAGVNTAGVTIRLVSNNVTIGSTTTDSSGTYFFWVVPAAYTITATRTGYTDVSTSVTLSRLDTPVTATPLNLVATP